MNELRKKSRDIFVKCQHNHFVTNVHFKRNRPCALPAFKKNLLQLPVHIMIGYLNRLYSLR